MKRETKYIIILVSLLTLFVSIQLFGPKPLDWTPTYLPNDKNPFGAYVTNTLIDPFFGKKAIETNNLTIYELQDSVQPGENIISLSDRFDPDDEAVKVLLNKVDSGSHAFISAHYYSGKFADTLKIFTSDVFFGGLVPPGGGPEKSDLKLTTPNSTKKGYYYKLENVSYFFGTFDSLRTNVYILSTNAWGKPVTLRIPWGKGYFIINSTPLAFSNNYLLFENNHEYVERTFSYLPVGKTWWTSYYQVGRLESETPLRFILNNEALRWAYYIVIFSFLLFLFFESKRKQRVIPILLPLSNTTLEFVKTIANMYLHASDHKGIAEKKISFFLDQIRSNYFLSAETGDEFIETVARKSGNNLEKTQSLFALIHVIQGSTSITERMLLDLNDQIENFTKKKL